MQDSGGAPSLPADGSIAPNPMPPATGSSNRWKTWQSDEDIPQRKILIQHM
jgi:E1A/CREB-binding protein